MRMCSRESLSRRCVLVKQVPEEVEEDCIQSIRSVEKSHRHNELGTGSEEVRWIVLMTNQDDAEKLIKHGHVSLNLYGQKLDLPVGDCPINIIPYNWMNSLSRSSTPLFFDTMEDSIGRKSISLREESVQANDIDDYTKGEKVKGEEKPEEMESQDIYIPSFVIPAISSQYKVEKVKETEKSEEMESQDKYVPSFVFPTKLSSCNPINSNRTASDVVINEQKTRAAGNQAQKEQLAQMVTQRNTGSPIAMHQNPGYQRTSNQESDGQNEANQTPDSQGVTAQGIENQTPRNRETEARDALYQNLEVFRTPDQGSNPGFMNVPQGQPSETSAAQVAVFPSDNSQREGMYLHAKMCLQKKHTIGGQNLMVEKYDINDPEMWEMNKVMVDRLNPVTTDDTLMNFLEPAAGVNPLEVVRGSEPNVVVVVFDEKPDFSKMSKRCNSKKLEGNTLLIQMVEKCRSVYVKDIDNSITYDTVENFFCNKKRSGDGEVEDVDHHPEDGYCVVHFENPADAENVASREKFMISGKEITVQMFYPCLGLPEQPINLGNLPSCGVDCNKNILKFVKNCEAVGKEIEGALHPKFVKVKWPNSKSDLKVKLVCSVTKEVENARRVLKNWEEEAKKSFESLMDKFVVKKHSIIPEAWQDFLAQLKSLHNDHPEKVAVLLEAKEHAVIVVGYEENAEALTREVLGLIKTKELKIKTQKEKIQKNVPLDFHKCQQLWKTQFQMKIKCDFPDVNVEINTQEVNFAGKPSEVNEAMIKMHEYLMNTKSKSLSISKGRHELFKTKEVRDLFLEEMKTKNNMAVWNLTEDKVEMTSSNMKMVEEALKLFEDCIPEKAIKVKRLVKVLTTPEWQACVKKLRESYGEKMYILSSASEVCITSMKDIFQPICKEVEEVLKASSKKCCVDRKHVRLSEAQFNYVKYFGEREMKDLTKDAKEQDLKINRIQEDHSIEISGNDEDVRRAKDELQRFMNRLSEDTYSITKPGAKTFFCSGKGLEAIKRTGKATSCIIMNKDGGRHNKENRESGSFQGHGARSRPKFPVKVAECDLHLGGKKFFVMKGDVTKLKVDIIVNEANGDLDHCWGLALDISRAGGELIQRESQDYIKTNKTVPDGGAVPAKPGNLPCQMLVHAVGPQWQGGNHQEEVNLRKAILKCLELTDRNNYSSIAVPALSAGIFGYPVDQSVETIISSILFYFNSKKGKSSKINEVYFCDADDKIVTAFIRGLRKRFGHDVKEFDGDEGVGDQSPSRDGDSDEESHRKRGSSSGDRKKWRRSSSGDREKRRKIEVISGELAKMRASRSIERESESVGAEASGYRQRRERKPSTYTGGGDRSWILNKLKVEVRQGDINDEKSDAIVNSITESIDLSKAQFFSSEGYVVTSGGRLAWKYIIHVKAQRSAKGWERIVTEALAHADRTGCRSISFPALGTGVRNSDPAEIARYMFKAMRKFSPENLERVRVIVFQRYMVTVFQSALDALPQGTSTQFKDYVSGKIKNVFGSDEEDENGTSRPWHQHKNHDPSYRGQGHGHRQVDERITFRILSNSEENINKAKIILDRILKNECERKEIDVSKYTFSQIDDIKRKAKDTKVIIKEGKIELMGLAANVNEAAVAIYQYLHDVKDKESALTVQKYVKWQFEASPDKWSAFRNDVNLQIENAFQAKKESCTVKDSQGTEYVIDFKKMEEYEKNNYRKKYKIKRVDKGSSSVGLPAKWAHMKNTQTVVEMKLKPGDSEYQKVMSKFNASSQGSVSVSEIRRVQNPYLYQQYATKRKEIQVKNGKDPQQWLWFGTYPESVDKIINNGFNRSYCGRHGTSYGAGVYFAVYASYSLGYCRADSNGHKHMFSVQVATGDACTGNCSMNVLPPKPGAGRHVTYDSASDNPSNPVMYVIFHDSQAYPAYHIIFK